MVSVKAKGMTRPCQVRIREASASELLMRCRNEMDDVRTVGRMGPQDKSKRDLLTAWAASGIKVART